jgi:hypothetical protein
MTNKTNEKMKTKLSIVYRAGNPLMDNLVNVFKEKGLEPRVYTDNIDGDKASERSDMKNTNFYKSLDKIIDKKSVVVSDYTYRHSCMNFIRNNYPGLPSYKLDAIYGSHYTNPYSFAQESVGSELLVKEIVNTLREQGKKPVIIKDKLMDHGNISLKNVKAPVIEFSSINKYAGKDVVYLGDHHAESGVYADHDYHRICSCCISREGELFSNSKDKSFAQSLYKQTIDKTVEDVYSKLKNLKKGTC